MNKGTKVILHDRAAKWFLEHPEVRECCGVITDIKGYDTEMQSLLLHFIAQPLTGVIGRPSPSMPNTYQVTFKTPFGKWWTWLEVEDLLKV